MKSNLRISKRVLCNHMKISLNTPIERTALETILRDKIAEFGSVCNIQEREIKIDDIGKKPC